MAEVSTPMYAPETPGSPAKEPSYGRDLLVLLIAFGILYFLGLGRAALMNPDEARYGEIPREMVVTGDWVSPRLDGVNYFEKPPLGYWVSAAFQQAFGTTEGPARAMTAFFGIVGVLVTYGAARRLHGRLAGLFSAVVLGTAALYYGLARVLTLDLAVSVLMAAVLFAFAVGIREAPGLSRRLLFYALYASSALATLTKGLIGFLVTGAVMFLWLLVFNQWRRLRPFYLPTGILLFLLIAAPWHLLAARANPTWAHFYFVDQQWLRFTTTEHSRQGALWYFVPVVIVGMFPWTVFLWQGCREAVSLGWKRRNEQALGWYYVTWAGFIFLFFSKSQSKLIPYILPIFPPLAVMVGTWLAKRWSEETPFKTRLGVRTRLGFNLFTFFCGILAVAALVAVYRPGILKDPDQAILLKPVAVAIASILILGGVTASWADRIWSSRAAILTLLATTVGFYLVMPLAVPYIKPGTKPLALYVKDHAAAEDVVLHYHGFYHDFIYYAQRFVGTVEFHGDEVELQNDPKAVAGGSFMDEKAFRTLWEGSRRVWMVSKADAAQGLFADGTFHYHLIEQSSGYYLLSNRP